MFAWLLARQQGGQFILRIEDTDKNREVAGAERHIIDSLGALRLDYDEGPDKPGAYGPYRQSERLDTYKQWADKLIAAGRAYADPYSPQQVQQFRDVAGANKQAFLYRNHRPDNPPAWNGSQPLRFRSEPKDYHWHDAVMGDLSAGAEAIDDFILIKSDGYPTYNFAHIVDDHEMAITHVIRGQEFISSVPNYLNLYEAMGISAPVLATMPHILNEAGNKKLSKRDGAKDILDYFRDGYIEEAMLNFIASLGWNDGTTQEIFSRAELIEKFQLDRVQRSGARFDERRLLWMNGYWLRQLALRDVYKRSADYWPPSAKAASDEYKLRVLDIVRERLKYLAELPGLTDYFFTDVPVNLSLIETNKQLAAVPTTDLIDLLKQSEAVLSASDFTAADLSERLNALLTQTGQKPAVLFSLIRIASTWAPASPGLADTLAVLGKERSLARLAAAIDTLAKQ